MGGAQARRKARKVNDVPEKQDAGQIFALDIGTRSIIGIVGRVEKGRFHVAAIEKEEHGRRAMLDGQIVEIEQVAEVAKAVLKRLEARTGMKLRRVCVAAAGRALQSQGAGFALEFPELRVADADLLGQLEAGAVSAAESQLAEKNEGRDRFYMVGYSARQYQLDGYPMANLMGHRGQRFEVEVVATFLPCGVVESLYAVVSRLGLEVASLTLEPIASLNAAIPEDIRLLNLVLADIGAGTSDLAVCREGSVVGYTMATVAGDEITEALMKGLLVDFKTAERLKLQIGQKEPLPYTDVLGMRHESDPEELRSLIQPAAQRLAKEIATKVVELNGAAPSAVFLAGGGAKLQGLTQLIAEELEMGESRVALAGRHFETSAYADEYDLDDPEFATPLGIAVSAALGMINDSYMVTLNGSPAKLFRSGLLTLRDVLLMNGYHYSDMMGHTGANLAVTLNGERRFFRGGAGSPAQMMLNGEEAALSDVVQAGDRIDFIPAVEGASAACTLGELLGTGIEAGATVNGRAEGPDYALQPGDVVETLGALPPKRRPRPTKAVDAPVKPAASAVSAPAASAPAKPAAPAVSAPAASAPAKPAAPAVSAPAASASAKQEGESLATTVVSKIARPAESPASPIKQGEREKQPEPLKREELQGQIAFGGVGAPLHIYMNGEALRLPPKAQGGDYFLMDVLEFSGLEFDKVDRPVEVLVNGQAGVFTQVLHERDDVVVRLKE